MRRNADADAVEPGRDQIGEAGAGFFRQDQGQGTRPEAGKAPRQWRELDQRFGHCDIGAMDDQGVEARSAFGLVDGQHRVRIGGIGAEPIDGFGWEGDEFAAAQQRSKIKQTRGNLNGRGHRGCLTRRKPRVKKAVARRTKAFLTQ